MGFFGKYNADPTTGIKDDGDLVRVLTDNVGRIQMVESGDAKGFESLTVSTSVVSLTVTPAAATQALITVEGADIRVRGDGTNPTSSVGHLFFDGSIITLTSAQDIASFRAVRDGSVNATLSITYMQ